MGIPVSTSWARYTPGPGPKEEDRRRRSEAEQHCEVESPTKPGRASPPSRLVSANHRTSDLPVHLVRSSSGHARTGVPGSGAAPSSVDLLRVPCSPLESAASGTDVPCHAAPPTVRHRRVEAAPSQTETHAPRRLIPRQRHRHRRSRHHQMRLRVGRDPSEASPRHHEVWTPSPSSGRRQRQSRPMPRREPSTSRSPLLARPGPAGGGLGQRQDCRTRPSIATHRQRAGPRLTAGWRACPGDLVRRRRYRPTLGGRSRAEG
jgi:hypothetical protein